MPELPDVEKRKEYFKRTSLRKTIVKIKGKKSYLLREINLKLLNTILCGNKFTSAKRRGKYLLAKASNNYTLLMHFGMTGDLVFKKKGEPPLHTQLAFSFKNGSFLYYTSIRKLGKIKIYPTKNFEEIPEIKNLGEEPLSKEFTLADFKQRIKNCTADIHTILMNQKIVAGIGNLYADEICFQAKIRPYRKIKTLNEDETLRLFKKIKEVLKEAISLNADLNKRKEKFLIPHRHSDKKCPLCKRNLKTVKLTGRTSYYCPTCQH